MRSGAAAIPAGSRSNENTNGLLCQYFRQGMSFAALSQDDLDTAATSLNDRPGKPSTSPWQASNSTACWLPWPQQENRFDMATGADRTSRIAHSGLVQSGQAKT